MHQGQITEILAEWANHDRRALAELIPLVFDELRRLARRQLALEAPYHTLQPTALVNEVYLRLVRSKVRGFENRSKFFAFAARLMREILVDYARAHRADKRGGGTTRVVLEEAASAGGADGLDPETVVAIDQALTHLARLDPRQCRIAELRYFGGLTVSETAQALGVSLSTVERGWSVARRWLAREILRST